MAPSPWRGRRRPTSLALAAALAAVEFIWSASATGTAVISAISPTSISVNHATTITLTGTNSGDKAAFLADCTTGTPSVDVSSGSASFTVVSTGTYNLCYQASGQADSVAQTGITLTVVAATSASAITAVSPTSVTVNTATTMSFTGYTSGDLAAFATTGSCSSSTPSTSISSGSGSFTLTSTGTYDLCLRASGGSDEVKQTAISVTAIAATSATAITAIDYTTITTGRNSKITLTFSGTAESGDLGILTASATACSSVTPNVDVSSGAGIFIASSDGTYKLCYRESGGSDSIAQTGITVTAASASQANAISSISPTSITVSTASTITFSPTPDTSDKVSFVTTGTSCSGVTTGTTIGSGSASFTIGTATTYDMCFQATGMTDWVKQTGISLTVAAATGAGIITSINTLSTSVGTATTILFSGHLSGSKGDWVSSGVACSTITPATSISSPANLGVFTFTSTGTYDFCYTRSGGTDSVKQTGISITVVAAGAAADPVTWHGDIRREFALPPGQLVTLLEAHDLTVSGATFQGASPKEQWFGRMVVRSSDGLRWMEVAIRKDMMAFNRSSLPRGGFESLEVTMGGTSPEGNNYMTRVQTLDTPVPFNLFGADVVFRRVQRNHRTQFPTIGKARRECVDVVGGYLHFYICSAAAWEYFGWQSHLAVKYAHLDVVVVQAKSLTDVGGLLPELWGLRPMSKETAGYLLESGADGEDEGAAVGNSSGLCESAAWAGGKRPQLPPGDACGAAEVDSKILAV